MTRRDFLRAAVGSAVALAASGLRAQEPAGAPPAPRVGLARADRLYLPYPIYAPEGTYPQGKLDWDVVDELVRRVGPAAGLSTPWELFSPADRVAVMLDVAPPAVPLILVDAVLDQLIRAGVAPHHLLLFAGDERDLFLAGFSLRSEGPGVRCLGAQSLGYRGGMSRIVLDMCDKIVSLARLRPHPQLGFTGGLSNYLNAVDAPWRLRLLQEEPEQVGALAERRPLRDKVVLHLVDCLHPAYALPSEEHPDPRWEYRGVLCSRDPVAVDLVGAALLEAQRTAVRSAPWPLEPEPSYLQAAARRRGLEPSLTSAVDLRLVGERAEALLEPSPASGEPPAGPT